MNEDKMFIGVVGLVAIVLLLCLAKSCTSKMAFDAKTACAEKHLPKECEGLFP